VSTITASNLVSTETARNLVPTAPANDFDPTFSYVTDAEGYDEPVFKPKIKLDGVSDPVVKQVAAVFRDMDKGFKGRARVVLRNAGEVVNQLTAPGSALYNAVIVLEAMVNQGFQYSESTNEQDIINFINELNDKNRLKLTAIVVDKND
jgi:hypothetical protein